MSGYFKKWKDAFHLEDIREPMPEPESNPQGYTEMLEPVAENTQEEIERATQTYMGGYISFLEDIIDENPDIDELIASIENEDAPKSILTEEDKFNIINNQNRMIEILGNIKKKASIYGLGNELTTILFSEGGRLITNLILDKIKKKT